MAFSNVLPDPHNPINDAGKADSSKSAPGFASVQVSSEFQTITNRTNSGRLIQSSTAGHKWSFSITYNPLLREDFEPVYNFLMHQKGKLSPFYLSLPQNRVPQDSVFAAKVDPTDGNKTMKTYSSGVARSGLVKGQEYKITVLGTGTNSYWNAVGAGSSPSVGDVFIATGTGDDTGGGFAAETYRDKGSDNLQITFTNYDVSADGNPKPGDFFTITDSSDTLHTKLYRVTRVETDIVYDTAVSDPDSNSLPTYSGSEAVRIYFSPQLQRNTYADASLNFHNPKPRVILSQDVQEYSLNSDNLYSFNVKLEEAQK